MRSSSKEVRRTVVVECYANKKTRKALREIEDAYREMLREMLEYALEHGASQSALHEVFYERLGSASPSSPRGLSRAPIGTLLGGPSPSESSRRGGGRTLKGQRSGG